MADHFDAAVIGAGQAGPSLVNRLTQAGKKVAMVERGRRLGSRAPCRAPCWICAVILLVGFIVSRLCEDERALVLALGR